MKKFARLMWFPFKFNVIHHCGDLSELNLMELDIKDDEVLAINFVNLLHFVSAVNNHREYLVLSFRSLRLRYYYC